MVALSNIDTQLIANKMLDIIIKYSIVCNRKRNNNINNKTYTVNNEWVDMHKTWLPNMKIYFSNGFSPPFIA
jgi:hypothetical protein